MKAHKVEPVKRLAEKWTGIGIPSAEEALFQLRPVQPRRLKFSADGYVPNNPTMPVLLYSAVVRLKRDIDPAALMEAIFNANGWGDAWRNGIYDFVHYHPRIHEVLGVARGSAARRQQGDHGEGSGRRRHILVPAGVGHECLQASSAFLVVGAYPPTGTYSECRGSYREFQKARAQIRRVPRPKKDPLFG